MVPNFCVVNRCPFRCNARGEKRRTAGTSEGCTNFPCSMFLFRAAIGFHAIKFPIWQTLSAISNRLAAPLSSRFIFFSSPSCFLPDLRNVPFDASHSFEAGNADFYLSSSLVSGMPINLPGLTVEFFRGGFIYLKGTYGSSELRSCNRSHDNVNVTFPICSAISQFVSGS